MTCDVTYDSDGKSVGDAELFAGMIGAMKILSFSEDDQKNIWKIVATVMHLGNIEFSGVLLFLFTYCVVFVVVVFVIVAVFVAVFFVCIHFLIVFYLG